MVGERFDSSWFTPPLALLRYSGWALMVLGLVGVRTRATRPDDCRCNVQRPGAHTGCRQRRVPVWPPRSLAIIATAATAKFAAVHTACACSIER